MAIILFVVCCVSISIKVSWALGLVSSRLTKNYAHKVNSKSTFVIFVIRSIDCPIITLKESKISCPSVYCSGLSNVI